MRLGRGARWLEALWREIKSAYPDAPFFPLAMLLVSLLSLSIAVGRAIGSDLEEALRFFVAGAATLGVFVYTVGRAKKSRALEILGAALTIVNSTTALYISFGVFGLVVSLALLAVAVFARYAPFARRKPP